MHWPTNRRVGANEVDSRPSPLNREAVYPASGREASVTATHGMVAGKPLRSNDAAT